MPWLCLKNSQLLSQLHYTRKNPVQVVKQLAKPQGQNNVTGDRENAPGLRIAPGTDSAMFTVAFTAKCLALLGALWEVLTDLPQAVLHSCRLASC